MRKLGGDTAEAYRLDMLEKIAIICASLGVIYAWERRSFSPVSLVFWGSVSVVILTAAVWEFWQRNWSEGFRQTERQACCRAHAKGDRSTGARIWLFV